MKVRVELQSYLADQYAPGDDAKFSLEVPDGATVSDILRKLGVPMEQAAVLTLGDEAVQGEQQLKEGDRVTVIPPVAGG
ncbi:MAG: MoaD/ThiS family protein [Chloroflexota bacterium]